ncbi:unnamed protein product [Calicophoron daubneyi]|uniref:T-cell immunomodulatory protein TIP C2 domain-containing protein n=1 Tax=Calicophoron daubneyi TaxID=300641 RepID=A0AAV2T2I1_CALDB
MEMYMRWPNRVAFLLPFALLFHGIYAQSLTSANGPSGSDFKTSVTWSGYQMAVFADLNADRRMDIILLDAAGSNLFAVIAPKSKAFLNLERFGKGSEHLPDPAPLLSPGFDDPIRSVAAADLTGDSIVDLLLLTSSSVDGPYKAYISQGLSGTRRGSFDGPQYLATFMTQPLICDLNADSVADLYGQTGDHERTVFYGGQKMRQENISYSGPAWSKLGYSAFGDVNGDTVPDILILVEEGGQPKIQLFQRSYHSSLPNDTEASLITLPAELLSTGHLTLGLFTLGDFDADGKMDLLLPACTSEDCVDSSFLFLYNFSTSQWSRIEVNWTPVGTPVQPNYKWSLTRTPDFSGSRVLSVGALVGSAIGDFDLDGRLDFGVALTYWSTSKQAAGTLPAVLLQQKKQSGDHLSFQAYLLHGAEMPANSTAVRQITFFDHLEKVTVLNGLCASEFDCPDGLLPYGLPVPGLSSSYRTESSNGDQEGSSALLGVQSCCSALQLPSVIYGLGPFANYVNRLSVAIPPNSSRLLQFTLAAVVPKSEVFINPYPHDDPSRWTAKLFLQPLYDMKVVYIAITLACICILLIIIISILQWLEIREDRSEKQKEAQRFHFDAM